MSWGVATRNAVGLGLAGIVSLVSRAVQQAVAVVDPFFNYVTLLLPGNGTNGAQNNTFVDSSTNAFTITRNGNTTQGTFSPFSQTGWGAYFDGSGDYLSGIGTVSDFNFMHQSSALFTFECWVYINSLAANRWLLDNTNSASSQTGVTIWVGTDGKIYAQITYGVTFSYVFDGVSTGTVPTNSWTHIAITYDQSLASDNAKFYINGVASGTGTKTANAPSASDASNAMRVGAYSSGSGPFLGYISNLRITNSIVYSSAFTPSTTPLTAIANTELLTCQSNRFIDNSTNGFAITVNGNTSIQAFSPFNPTAAWDAATNGGSGYFDGSGDYLSTANVVALSGDFTVECWVYYTALNNATIISSVNSSGYGNWVFYYNNTANTLRIVGTSAAIYIESSTLPFTPTVNSWNHFAVSRSGSTVYWWANGQAAGTTTNSTNWTGSNTTTYIGIDNAGGFPLSGYLSGLRVITGAGSAIYTSAFTPPTAPVTNVSGTWLLCNFTNAGIFDATAKNDLETVGDAQISTTQSQWGGSSMYFDATDDRLVAAASPNIALGTGDFTVEAWVRSADVSNANQRGWIQTSDTAGGLKTTYTTGIMVMFGAAPGGDGTVRANVGGTDYISAGSIVAVDTWYHIAVTRASGAVDVWVNGTSVASGSGNTANLSGQNICVGGYYSTTYLFSGYLQDLRITKGIARYTTGFTPPTAAFPLT